ncbi:hypothetical protein PTKIN_Ptkin09bG0237500 [Pterospermum kingtungense]
MTDEDKANRKYIGDNYYQDSVTIVFKGLAMVYEKILTTLTCLDLFNNSFHGIIPKEIGNLTSLIVLNLSQNSFYGRIPLALGNLKELESLDLSKNNLSGEIPPQLTTLTFLSALNLSENQLEGSIPQGNQFGTFLNDSYKENRGLCGQPLTKRCNEADVPMAPPGEDADSREWEKESEKINVTPSEYISQSQQSRSGPVSSYSGCPALAVQSGIANAFLSCPFRCPVPAVRSCFKESKLQVTTGC